MLVLVGAAGETTAGRTKNIDKTEMAAVARVVDKMMVVKNSQPFIAVETFSVASAVSPDVKCCNAALRCPTGLGAVNRTKRNKAVCRSACIPINILIFIVIWAKRMAVF